MRRRFISIFTAVMGEYSSVSHRNSVAMSIDHKLDYALTLCSYRCLNVSFQQSSKRLLRRISNEFYRKLISVDTFISQLKSTALQNVWSGNYQHMISSLLARGENPPARRNSQDSIYLLARRAVVPAPSIANYAIFCASRNVSKVSLNYFKNSSLVDFGFFTGCSETSVGLEESDRETKIDSEVAEWEENTQTTSPDIA